MKLCGLMVLMLACCTLASCAAQPIWRDYDKCAKETSDFVTMVRCGKMEREAALEKYHQTGSDVGNAFEQYADALAAQVENKQITDADAWARFAEYKTKVINDTGRNQAIRDAGIAAGAAAAPPANPPRLCVPAPGVSCF